MTTESDKRSFGVLTPNQTNLMKGLGMLAIMFHNYFHWVSPSTGENEFDFSIDRLLNLGQGLVKMPFESINLFFTYFGHFGVQLFILVSGYGLAMSCRGRSEPFSGFIGRRLNRLYPAFLLAVGLLLVLIFFKSNDLPPHDWFRSIGYKLMFVANLVPGELFSVNGPWWFYGLIVQLYILFPLLNRLYLKYGTKGLLVPVVLGYLLLFFVNPLVVKGDVNLMGSFPGHLAEFSLGIWLAHNPAIVVRWWYYVIAFVVFSLGNVFPEAWLFSFLAVAFLLVGLSRRISGSGSQGSLFVRFLIYIGELSMYLFAVHGFLRAPFVAYANQAHLPLVTIALSVIFFVISLLAANGIRLVADWIGKTGWPDSLHNIIQFANVLKQPQRKRGKRLVWFHYYFIFVVLAILLRLVEVLVGTITGAVGNVGLNLFYYQFFYADFILLIELGAIWYVIHTLLAFLSYRVARVFNIVLIVVYGIISVLLIGYFQHSRFPLDHSLYFYSIKDIIAIAGNSADFAITDILPVSLFTIALFFLIKFPLKGDFRLMTRVIVFSGLIFLAGGVKTGMNPSVFVSESDYLVTVNKTKHFIGESYGFLMGIDHEPAGEEAVRKAAEIYQRGRPSVDFESSKFPFWHSDRSENVLAPYLGKPTERPNIVVIVVESLGFEIAGPAARFGSFTPFLDSLALQGLYWPNCLSTSQRTFGVLPSLLGSLPYGLNGFLSMREQMPLHRSLMTELVANDYFLSFNYGGDSDFQDMKPFLIRNRFDYILPDPIKADTTLSPELYNEWGFFDDVMFSRSVDALRSLNISKPRLDVYLTLSTHEPFSFPDRSLYEAKALAVYQQLPDEQKRVLTCCTPFAAALVYTDQSLRNYFNRIKNLPGFENTIFIITGDHSNGWFPGTTNLDKYHVPLIVYSPLVTKPSRFDDVVSHLDVVPSLLSYLGNSCDLKISQANHWLGDGLRVSGTFNHTGSMTFMLNNRSVREFLSGDYYLESDKLFRLLPHLKVEPVDKPDEQLIAAIKEEFESALLLHRYVCEANALIPSRVADAVSNKVILVDQSFNYDKEGKDVPYAANLSTERSVSGGRSLRIGPTDEFGYLADPQTFANSPRKALLKMTGKVFVKNSGQQLPRVVFHIVDAKKESVVYDSQVMAARDNQPLAVGNWIDYLYIKEFDLTQYALKDTATLKVYLWNKDKSELFFDDTQVRVTLEPL